MDEERAKILIEEFKEAGHLHCLHVTLMFGQITVFLGSSAAIFHQLASVPPLNEWAVRLLASGGFFLSLLFLILHERVYAYSHGAVGRAQEIQRELSLALYQYQPTRLPLIHSIQAAFATRALYIISAIIWVGVFVFGKPFV